MNLDYYQSLLKHSTIKLVCQEDLQTELRLAHKPLQEVTLSRDNAVPDWGRDRWRDFYTPEALQSVYELCRRDFEWLSDLYDPEIVLQ